MIYYRQCTFKNNNAQQTAWIEERGAKVGLRLTFEDEDGVWVVTHVGETRMPEKAAKAAERQFLRHRQFSDI